MDHCCRKDDRIPEFSGVISATRALPIPAEVVHGHFHHTATPTQGRADSPVHGGGRLPVAARERDQAEDHDAKLARLTYAASGEISGQGAER